MTYVFTLGQTNEEVDKAQSVGLLGNELGERTTAGSAIDLLKTITGAIGDTGLAVLAQSDTKIIFRSNASPEMVIDVTSLLKGEQAAAEVVASDSSALTMRLLAPKISFRAKNLGFITSSAPYGDLIPNAWIIFIIIIAASGMLGAKIAWTMCSKIPAR